MSQLKEPSKEQTKIVNSILSDRSKCLRIDSVAGSGKTTTVLYLANALRFGERILLLTYNARLKQETRDRVKILGLGNLEVHSYHSLGVKYYDSNCCKDSGLREVLDNDTPVRNSIPNFSIVIIDEAQDMTALFLDLVTKFLKDHSTNVLKRVQMVVVGDEMQGIYGFKEADSRYLTMAEHIFSSKMGMLIAPNWESERLSTSFRMTGNMARFVNEVLLQHQKVVAFKSAGETVDYYVGCPWDAVKSISSYIINQIKIKNLSPDDVFVLCPSLKASPDKKPPFKVLENSFAEKGIPVFVPSNDDSGIVDNLAANKVVFSTYHQAKGLERKVVVVFGFNADYFKYFAKESDSLRCPETIYVAATRAMQKFIIIGESNAGSHIPFMNRKHLQKMSMERNSPVKIITGKGYHDIKSPLDDPLITRTLEAMDLLNFVPDHILSTAAGSIKWTQLAQACDAKDIIKLRGVIDGEFTSSHLPQKVAELNGLAIPAMLECKLRGNTCQMYEELLSTPKASMHPKVTLALNSMAAPEYGENPSPEYFLKLAAVYTAGAGIGRRGFISYLTQLARFDWMPTADAQRCLSRLESAVCYTENDCEDDDDNDNAMGKPVPHTAVTGDGMDLKFEFQLSTELLPEESTDKFNVELVGLADIDCPTVLWEIKCTNGLLESVHFLQLAIYAWIWQRQENSQTSDEEHNTDSDTPSSDSAMTSQNKVEKKFRLFNVLSGELWELDPSCMVRESGRRSGLDEAVGLLLRYHYRKFVLKDDEEFLRSANITSKPSMLVNMAHDEATAAIPSTGMLTPKKRQIKEEAVSDGENRIEVRRAAKMRKGAVEVVDLTSPDNIRSSWVKQCEPVLVDLV